MRKYHARKDYYCPDCGKIIFERQQVFRRETIVGDDKLIEFICKACAGLVKVEQAQEVSNN